MAPRGRIEWQLTIGRDRPCTAGLAPKEQPPRKLSGKRTGRCSARNSEEWPGFVPRPTAGASPSARRV